MKFYFLFIFVILFGNFNTQFDDEPRCTLGENCRLPICNCDSDELPIELPNRYHLTDLPQLVVLSIDDDGLDIKSYQVYRKLFENRKNPNNCSIKATFFVSDSENTTSYCLTRSLYDNGHEIAISTVNNTCPHKRCSPFFDFQPWNYEKWSYEILNMRERLNRYAGIPKSQIIGFRAPILEPASDMHFRIISSNKFLYDSSLIFNTDNIIWPFTLDYKFNSYLSNNGPIHRYPGLWQIPVPTYVDIEDVNIKCLNLWEGHCKFEKSVNGIAKFLRRHFLRAYYNNRAPLVFHFSAKWLKEFKIVNETEIMPNVGFANREKTRINFEKKEYTNLDGLIKFVNKILKNNKDVYFVTARQAIEWMRLLPRLKKENISDLLDNYMFENCPSDSIFDGKCPIMPKSDYDLDQGLILDDSDGDRLREMLKIDPVNKGILTDLQTEVLYVNSFVGYFILGMFITLILIIIKDKYF